MIRQNNIRGRVVLLVDNDRAFVDSNADALKQQGYTVLCATSADEALAILQDRWIHLAVIDNRLIDDEDPLDFNGVKLALNQRLHVFPRIIYTAYPSDVAIELFERYFGSLPLGVSVQTKRNNNDNGRIVEIVNTAFYLAEQNSPGRVGIRFDQRLIYTNPPSTLSLISLLKDVPTDGDTLMAWVGEMDDLFGKAFADCEKLTVSLLYQGRSGGVVLVVTPHKDGEDLRPLVVKCGNRRPIITEYRNYQDHIREFVDWAVHLDEERPVETLHFGLLKYRIANGNIEDTITLADFYRRNDTDTIKKAIQHLFRAALAPLYPNRRERQESLSRFYENRLLFQSDDNELIDLPNRWSELGNAISQVLAQPLATVVVKAQDDKLQWSFDGRTFDLPHPYKFLAPIRAGSYQLFGARYRACRNHGDLHVENIRVDDGARTWLLDFEHTGWGPLLQDAVELESSIHFGLIQERQLERLLLLEAALAEQSDLNVRPTFPDELRESSDLVRVFEVIAQVRHEAGQIEGAYMADYLLGLIYQGLRVIQSERSPRWADMRRLNFYKIQALFLVSACCQRLAFLPLPPSPP